MAKYRDDDELNIEIIPPEEVIAEQEKASGSRRKSRSVRQSGRPGRHSAVNDAAAENIQPEAATEQTESAGGKQGIQRYFHFLAPYRQRLVVWGIIAAAVVAAVLIGVTIVRHWAYHSYKVVGEQTVDNAISSEYCSLGGNVLRYGTDGASLISRSQNMIWEINYRMDAPKVSVSGTTAAVFDSDGSTIVICDESGELGTINTDMPIVRADVSSSGTVAALLGDTGSNSNFLRYYKTNGEEIASIKTSINEPGYPMDIALSEDGMLLAVSYLSYADNTMKSLIRFYNFDDIGQNQMDNRVGQFEMEDILVPEIEYLSGTTAVAFRDNGFVIFEGDTVPEKKQEVKVNEEIESVFYSDRYIGLVLDNNADDGETVSRGTGGTSDADIQGDAEESSSGTESAGKTSSAESTGTAGNKGNSADGQGTAGSSEKPFIINVYDLNGRELARKPMDFMFETVEFSGNQISFYNRNEMCVFGLDGTEKYRGSYEEHTRQLFSVDTKTYVAADEDGITWIRLR
ncbi:MAG: hypothetical protein IJI10_12075 [Eubacterium sp.]|nr:hypothetical protein [Eubacterium sp.]